MGDLAMSPGYTYTPDERGLYRVLHAKDGIVSRDLYRRARIVRDRAQRSVGVKSGRLKASIKISGDQARDTGGRYASGFLQVEVGSGVPYALLHHTGTRPHVILPRKPGGRLRFEVAGRIVFARRVNHPGTRPNRYLTRYLIEAAR